MMKAIGARTLKDIGSLYLQYDVIGIDEGQFFADVVSWSDQAANDGKVVIISALDGTFMRTGFECIL
jgi:thymidine kinase